MTRTDTPTKILDAAETLFAERGFSATSMRDITSAAGVNLAAVNYHFGSKEQLAQEVVGRLVAPVNQERLRRLKELDKDGERPTLEGIVRAFVAPAAKFRDGKTNHLKMIGQIMTGPEGVREAVSHNFETVTERFTEAVARAAPHLSRAEVMVRWRLFLGSFTALMMPLPMVRLRGRPEGKIDLVEAYVAYSVAGLGAREAKP